MPVKVTTETAWQNLFGRNMFIRPESYNGGRKAEWSILNVASFVCEPERDGTNSDGVVIVNFAQRKVLLAGMRYAGEMKKSMFCGAELPAPGKRRDAHALLAPTSATTAQQPCFSACPAPARRRCPQTLRCYLIGDDEHGWAKGSVFNLEGGCYAKTIDLSQKNEPIIWDAIRFGAIIENVVVRRSQRHADYCDTALTENGRCCYPLEHVEKRTESNAGGEPKCVIFLTCDVSGVLPPVSILSKEAAAYPLPQRLHCASRVH